MSQSNRDNTSDMETVVMLSKQQDESNHHAALSGYDDHHREPSCTEQNDESCEHDQWALQIKMVGNETNQSHFHISLHPNDDISQLYQEIALVTNIPHHQQRLIYRGRLLPHWTNVAPTPDLVPAPATDDDDDVRLHTHGKMPASATMATTNTESRHAPLNQKVRDIVGLMNGHAIHLVVRPPSTDDEPTTITADPASTTTSSSSSSSGSTSLLAALLGMGSSRTATTSANSNHPRRHATYRLTDDDWVRPDPGSLETVRQGLMTFHTLQQFHPPTTTTCNDAIHPSPLPNRCGRHFYLGQWIDCRDTVNQWLEATVVSILHPRDIMHSYQNITTALPTSSDNVSSSNASLSFQPTTDPPVAMTDFDGRRRLLLEPCTESESEECIDGEHYRRRSSNEHVQILHIHYNGWPVRWDEWIRSDSERIRVFRTRTRHRPTSVDELSQRQFASPNIDTVMPDAPYTYMTNSEPNDRSALLPELHRALESLQQRVATVSDSGGTTTAHSTTSHSVITNRMNHLPWMTGGDTTASNTATMVSNQSSTIDPEPSAVHRSLRLPPVLSREQQRKELEALAPLLDRLGRVLIDAAPHVLALADSIGKEEDNDEDEDDNNESQVEDADLDETEPHETRPATNTLGGLLSLLNRDRRVGRGSVASGSNVALPSVVSDVEISTVASSSTTTTDVVVHPTEPTSPSNEVARNVSYPDDDEEVLDDFAGSLEDMDPDFRDYATGLVNTSRGDVRSTNTTGNGSSSGSRRGISSDDGTTSLLGAYLAAMSLGGIASISTSDREDGDGGGVAEGLGRLLRDRGTGSGGIDIHIHAVVTAPGLDGAIGFAALTGGGGTGGGATFPVATPVTGPGTPTNGANGGMGNLFPGSTSLRRGGSRRFRSTTSRTVDATPNEEPTVDETNAVDGDELDLFADLYSETPDPINPSATYLGSTATVIDEENMENPESIASSSSPVRRSLRHAPPSGSSHNSSEQYQHFIPRSNRNEHRSVSNEQRHNNNLLRRIFRRPDGSH